MHLLLHQINLLSPTNTKHTIFTKRVMEVLLLTLLALVWGVSACTPSDKAALLEFRSSLDEPYLGIFNTWSGDKCCAWYGVSCDPTTQRVTDISLRGESEDPIFEKAGRSGYMTGSINPAICQLDRLSNLVIADWKGISGQLPPCLTSISSLRVLDVVGNKISGHIPENIGNLQKLTVLNLADNAISGGLPGSLVQLSSLKHLDLSNNQLSGQIPQDFGKLKMLSRALLARNKLTGSIPASIGNMYRLADLDLSMNQLSGSVAEQLGKMRVLSTLNLDSNSLSGQIPPALLRNTGMGILNLSRNSLKGNIPDVFNSKSYFMALDLSYNNLKGPVPGSLSSAAYVGHLDLSHNHLCGAIPIGSPFDHLEASSFVNNDCLCGNPLRTCWSNPLVISAKSLISVRVSHVLFT